MGEKTLRRLLWVSTACALIMVIAILLLVLKNTSLQNELNDLKSEKLVGAASISQLPQVRGVEIQCPPLGGISNAQLVPHQQTQINPTAVESALLAGPLPIMKSEPINSQPDQNQTTLLRKAITDARISAQERPPGLSQSSEGGKGPAAFKEAVRAAHEAARKNNTEENASSAASPFRSK